MQYRKDKKNGAELSVLGFGCMRFPKTFGITDMKKTEALIVDAVQCGINYFDTAWLYPGSEEALGTVVAKKNLRGKIYIATKLPLYLCKNKNDFDKYFDSSKARLKTGYVDYYLLHMLSDIESFEKLKRMGLLEWLEEKKESGEIKRFGFSFHGLAENFLKLLDAYDWDFVQIQYNYSNENFQAGRKGLKAAAEKGLPVIIMEPLLGGRLVTHLPVTARAVFRKSNPELSPAGWGLNWLWDQSDVTVILSGMSDDAQLKENLLLADKAHENCLTEKDRSTYNDVLEAFNASYKVHCTGCAYCMPCPKNVNIPGCFAAYNTSFAITKMEGMKQYVTSTIATASGIHRGASLCVNCGSCKEHCPQNLPIPQLLEKVVKRMEPFYFRIIIFVARLFLGKAEKTRA
ncbi:MAG: aldo/keto reductase [Termitinemataceae bacterium]|nr:MAG: aldo/keto reductase [Termitinemataceae bacterium]